MKQFPAIIILCKNEDCFGGMYVEYNEFDTEGESRLRTKVGTSWNKRV